MRYRITADAGRPRAARRQARIDILDPAVAEGQWTWEWRAEGLAFTGRRDG